MDVNQLSATVATFTSRMTLIEAKAALLDAKLAAAQKLVDTLTNSLYALEGKLLTDEARLGVK